MPLKEPFNCRRCKKLYTPREGQLILWDLCASCFILFNAQKMRGRFSGIGGKDPFPYFESVDEWLEDEKKPLEERRLKYQSAMFTVRGEPNREDCVEWLDARRFTWSTITCDDCPSSTNGECTWAYDPYNTDGNCLAVK